MTRRDILIFPDLTSLSRAAADLVLSEAGKAVTSHGRFSLALSGGLTPRTLYACFAQHPWRETMPWGHVHVFWADERCVPPDHQDSNYHLTVETFLSRVPLPAGNVHRIRGEEVPDRAAAGYERELKDFFGAGIPDFDLILLGAGEDGHTASLFPGSAELGEQNHLALPVHRAGPQLSRVTLSLSVLNNARNILFLVSGPAKSGIVRRVLEDGAPSRLPAAQVQPRQGRVIWMLDRETARDLPAEVPTAEIEEASFRK